MYGMLSGVESQVKEESLSVDKVVVCMSFYAEIDAKNTKIEQEHGRNDVGLEARGVVGHNDGANDKIAQLLKCNSYREW